jgi:hypothetical protein
MHSAACTAPAAHQEQLVVLAVGAVVVCGDDEGSGAAEGALLARVQALHRRVPAVAQQEAEEGLRLALLGSTEGAQLSSSSSLVGPSLQRIVMSMQPEKTHNTHSQPASLEDDA